MAISILITFRNPLVNFFQSIITVFLFACNTHKNVYRALNRMGVSTAHSTVHGHLNRLGDSTIRALKVLGRRAYESSRATSTEAQQYFMLVFDNINKYHLARNQTVASKNRMKNGTAATAIVLEDVPPNAFDPKAYRENVNSNKRQSITVETLFEDIDQEHLAKVGAGLVMRTIIAYVPEISKDLRNELEASYKDTSHSAKHRLRLRKAQTLPLGTSAIDETSAKGVSDILHDLVSTQMAMKPHWFDKLLILVGGDQLSVDRLRKTVLYKAHDDSVYESRSWALPLIQLWHMKWAYLKSIFRVHWFSRTNSELFGLRHGIEALGRKVNQQGSEFYPSHKAVKTVFEGMVITATL